MHKWNKVERLLEQVKAVIRCSTASINREASTYLTIEAQIIDQNNLKLCE